MQNYLISYTAHTSDATCISNIMHHLAEDGCQSWSGSSWVVTSSKPPAQLKKLILDACKSQLSQILIVPLPAANDMSWSTDQSDKNTWFNDHL